MNNACQGPFTWRDWVCGSDDKTYYHMCELEKAYCTDKESDLHFYYKGACKWDIGKFLCAYSPNIASVAYYVSMTFYFINSLFIHLFYSGRCRDREVVCRYVPFMDPDCKSEHAQRNCPKYCGTC